jgi:hypothetical protein
VLGHALQAVVEHGDVVAVDGVDVGAGLGDAEDVGIQTTVFHGQAFFALADAFDQVAQVDVEFGAASGAGLRGVEGAGEVLRETVLEVARQGFADELFLHADGGLFAPDRELLLGEKD